jgi:guanylate kinase
MSRLIVLSGPSCVGKSPLVNALGRFHPDLLAGLQPVVLYNDRAPRPGERDGIDYHFRRRTEIEALRDDPRYRVLEVRGDLQAVDLEELATRLAHGDLLFEGNPTVGRLLLEAPLPDGAERHSAFVAPLGREEITDLQRPELHLDLESFVADVMRRKLLRRMHAQKTHLALPDLEEVERRCRSAWGELLEAWRFDWVIPNHDGEDSEHWGAFGYPVGDARRTMLAVADLLSGREPRGAETWPAGLLDDAANAPQPGDQ